jgi:2,3-bisphosphoglycerate-dependent phosphoglycerate mutase
LKRLYIVRHCSAEGQSPDAPLTWEGRKQAERLSAFLKDKDIESIISSPYVRAMTSIEPLAEALNLQVHDDPRLSERVLSSEPLDNWLDCLEQTFADFGLAHDGGETSEQAMERATQVLNEVLAGNHRNVVLVTHGNLMTLLLRHFDERFGFQEWAALTNPDVYRVTVNGSETSVERVWE